MAKGIGKVALGVLFYIISTMISLSLGSTSGLPSNIQDIPDKVVLCVSSGQHVQVAPRDIREGSRMVPLGGQAFCYLTAS